MKYNINKKFDEILMKNGIIKNVLYDNAIHEVNKLENSYISGNKIGIYGVGIEAEGLLHFISEHSRDLKIDVCFDKTIRNYKFKELIINHNVYPIEKIADMGVDYIIIGSFNYRQDFINNLNDLGYSGNIVDLFSCMEAYIEDHYADYNMVYHTRQKFLKSDGDSKIHNLKKLIKECLMIKDFCGSLHYMNEYINNMFPGYEMYIQLRAELNSFLHEIKECIKKRNKKDIIINWVDALSYYDISDFPFLKYITENGVSFENAYTVMPWTTETTKTIMFGEYPIEGKLFLKENLSSDNVKLLKILNEHGYKFVYCGMPKFSKLFNEDVITPVHIFENKYSGSMQKQWDALNVICQSENPVCILIHTLRETHEPFICGEGDSFIYFGSTKADWSQNECLKQVETAGKYIDKQLKFYESFYKESSVEIYMSDHGRVGNSPMNEKKIHTMLMISCKDYHPCSVKNMFSLVKFPDLILKIIRGENDWDSLTDDYVIIQNLDAYNELVVRDTISGRLSKEEMYQCRGVVTMKDMYFLYTYGKEYYFTDHSSTQNEIDNYQYADRISKLKKLCGRDFIDIFKYDKFKYSRRLYVDTE